MSGGGKNFPDTYLELAKYLGADLVFSKPFDLDNFLKETSDLLLRQDAPPQDLLQ